MFDKRALIRAVVLCGLLLCVPSYAGEKGGPDKSTIIRGTVVYPDGSPVSGAAITFKRFKEKTATDSAGVFAVGVKADPNGVNLTVSAGGDEYDFQFKKLNEVNGVTDVGRIIIGTLFSGVLRFADGTPAGGASVGVVGGGASVTAGDGRFVVPSPRAAATAATFNFALLNDAFSATVTNVRAVPGGTTNVGIFSTGTIVTGVVKFTDGAPVAGASVGITGFTGAAVTGADGSFSLPLPVANFSSVSVTIDAGGSLSTVAVGNVTPMRGGSTALGTLTIVKDDDGGGGGGGGGTGLLAFSSVDDESFGGSLNGPVYAMTVFDDGHGPALYAGGSFTTASTTTVNYIARWDGAVWSAVGGGLDGPVHALTVHDDGSGPALYAGGSFDRAADGTVVLSIAKWNGLAWSALGGGLDGTVHALASFDSGAGPALYAGGSLEPGFNGIAMWNSSSMQWSALDDGVQVRHVDSGGNLQLTSGVVFALAAYDDGAGPALYIGGRFNQCNGQLSHNLAKWDGSAYLPAPGVSSPAGDSRVLALTTFNGGLWVGGNMDSTIADPHSAQVFNLAQLLNGQFNDGYTGGVGSSYDHFVSALTVHDDGSGPALYIGGLFDVFYYDGTVANNLARWDGTTLTPLADAGNVGADGPVYALQSYADAHGPALYVGGDFAHAGASSASHIARWQRD